MNNMSDFLQRLKTEVLVAFGAVATELERDGFNLSGFLGGWIVEHPEAFKRLLKAYIDVGCHLLGVTGSQGTRFRLEKWGLQDKVIEVNIKATKIAREVTPPGGFVVGSCMASGRILEPLGDTTSDQIYNGFREEVVGYAEGGADVIWIMTMFDIQEAVLAVKAAKDFTKLPVIASMSFDFTPKGGRTMMGVDPKTAVEKLLDAGADVIGHNCGGATPEESTHIMREMGAITDKPLVVKPNAGVPESVDGRQVYPATPERYAKEVPNWIGAGARIVGGCCGAGLEHTAKIAKAVRTASL